MSRREYAEMRNYAIELLRLLFVYGIVLLHTIRFGGAMQRGLDNVLMTCVVGFVFISGYFGIKFKLIKLIRLIGAALFCAVAISIINMLIQGEFSSAAFLSGVKDCYLERWWFLWAYVALMCFAPIVESAVKPECLQNRQWVRMLPLLSLVYVWSYSQRVPILCEFMPRTPGVGTQTFLTLIAIYTSAAIFRSMQLEKYATRRNITIVLCITLPITAVGVAHYDSIPALFQAAALFCLFKRFKLSDKFSRLLQLLGPSMFSVYLLHANCVGYFTLRTFNMKLIGNGVPLYCSYFTVAFSVFVLALAIDSLRRIGLFMGASMWKGIHGRL